MFSKKCLEVVEKAANVLHQYKYYKNTITKLETINNVNYLTKELKFWPSSNNIPIEDLDVMNSSKTFVESVLRKISK